jgi:hypothetical protein
MYPTVKEAKTTGPLGSWKRLPMPVIELGPDGPPQWWQYEQGWSYLDHNILKETERADPNFNRAAISTKSMHQWMHKLTNQQRREGIIACAVAFEQFMEAQLPDAEWWLEGGSLIGALRTPHRFIPWCAPRRASSARALRPARTVRLQGLRRRCDDDARLVAEGC